ncbi:hypothetical protein BTN49_2796 [Candidatus Enterovibrio escicola]|uniref:Uncharacterized protein n=1 Tax=Candidatus Enterovibrio escicola TaxID=1927127 RepID=A0A2A5T0E8_9GAMM|nr:hypothetical protein BTN49_2796 [Candidatus Enterovibrio escacola]
MCPVLDVEIVKCQHFHFVFNQHSAALEYLAPYRVLNCQKAFCASCCVSRHLDNVKRFFILG